MKRARSSEIFLGGRWRARRRVVPLLAAAAVGSAVTVVGTAGAARPEYVEALERSGVGNGTVMVAQFAVELRGLRTADSEEPPRVLHLNPRLRGDWSQRPVVEINTCFRMQWGKAQRCDGSPSKDDDHVERESAWTGWFEREKEKNRVSLDRSE